MTKTRIARTWIAGLIAFAAGIVVALTGVFLMLAYGGTFTEVAGTSNYTFTPNLNGFFWVTIADMVVGGLIALAGIIVQLAAWVGALINSYALVDRSWFTILLVGGALSVLFAPVGFAVMVAYVIAAPDGLAWARTQPAPPWQPAPSTPTS